MVSLRLQNFFGETTTPPQEPLSRCQHEFLGPCFSDGVDSVESLRRENASLQERVDYTIGWLADPVRPMERRDRDPHYQCTSGSQVRLLKSEEADCQIVHAYNKAKSGDVISRVLHQFLIDDEHPGTATRELEALCEAARRGVKVHVLLCAWGCECNHSAFFGTLGSLMWWAMPGWDPVKASPVAMRMRAAGIDVHVINNGYTWATNSWIPWPSVEHCKLASVFYKDADDLVAFSGGKNLSDDRDVYRHDLMAKMRGPAAVDAHIQALLALRHANIVISAQAGTQSIREAYFPKNLTKRPGNTWACAMMSMPQHRCDFTQYALEEAAAARPDAPYWATAPYVTVSSVARAMRTASGRGADARLVTIDRDSHDSPSAYHALMALMPRLTEDGSHVRVMFTQFYSHMKLYLFGKTVMVTSHNWDGLSKDRSSEFGFLYSSDMSHPHDQHNVVARAKELFTRYFNHEGTSSEDVRDAEDSPHTGLLHGMRVWFWGKFAHLV